LFAYYLDDPALVRTLYENITRLMLRCLDYFPAVDGRPLAGAGIGNCSVTMLSPADYMRCDYEFDRRIMNYCREHGLAFGMHQDSNVTPHLDHYAKLEYTSGFSFGMDTDFARLADLFPNASVSCLWFPHWLRDHSPAEIADEVRRLLEAGRRFPVFNFSVQDVDPFMDDEKLRGFYQIVQEEARKIRVRLPL
ncbi:MAG TPA: uroporphyrinogen decarboxylase family protein, partial [Armatimonadota bacterium]